MQRNLVGLWLGVLLVSAASSAAAQDLSKKESSARAALISRFVAPDAFAVAHLDVTRLKVEPLFAELKRLGVGDRQQIETTETAVEESVSQFLKAGGRDAFVVLSPNLLPLLVVPLSPGADEATILAILGQAPFETTEKLGGAIVAGSEVSIARLRDVSPKPRPELAEAFAAAGDTAAQVLLIPTEDNRRVIEQMLPKLPAELGGAATQPIARGLTYLAVGIDGPPKLSLHFLAAARDAHAADDIKTLLTGLLDALAKRPEFAKLFPDQAGLRKLLVFKVSQNRVALVLDGRQLVEQLKSPLEHAREAAKRTQSINTLKQLGLAMHNYHDVNQSFPPAVRGKDGKPLLSWRVLVLPYLDEEKLFREFHLDEPWDSPHNKQLIGRMPAVFRSPLAKLPADGSRTVYLTPRGMDTAFPGQEGIKLREITDGTSNTIMLVEADDEHAVTWTRPDDWDFDPDQPTRGLRLVDDTGYLFSFCDGSVQLLGKNIKPATLIKLLTRAGGEVIPADRQ